MSLFKEHLLYKKVVAASVDALLSKGVIVSLDKHKWGYEKDTGSKYLPYSERKTICRGRKLTPVDFLHLGLSNLSIPKDEKDKIIAHENSDSYRALLGFSYLYHRTAKGSCKYIAEQINVNKNYVRQLLSEYSIGSVTLLSLIASLYGLTYTVLVEIGALTQKAEDVDTAIDAILRDAKKCNMNSAKVVPIPYLKVLPIDISIPKNVTILVGLALNKVITSAGLWSDKRIARKLNIADTTYQKIINFSSHTNYTSSYTTHLAIAEALDINLYDFYEVGIDEYVNFTANNYEWPDITKETVKEVSLTRRKKAVDSINYIIDNIDIRSVKSHISTTADIGMSHLSRILHNKVLPGDAILAKVADIFGITYNQLCTIVDLSEDKKKEILEHIMNTSSVYMHYKMDKQNVVNMRKKYIVAIINSLITLYGEKGIKVWAEIANVSYSCLRNIRDKDSIPTKRTITKLAAVLDSNEQELLHVGSLLCEDLQNIEAIAILQKKTKVLK